MNGDWTSQMQDQQYSFNNSFNFLLLKVTYLEVTFLA